MAFDLRERVAFWQTPEIDAGSRQVDGMSGSCPRSEQSERGDPFVHRSAAGTDSQEVAKVKAPTVWAEMVAHWEALLAGDTTDAEKRYELMRWMPPPDGILYAMMVSSKPNGGHINDDNDQYAGLHRHIPYN